MSEPQTAQERVALNRQLAQMLKGGVIMDVTTPEQAKIAEAAGACAVMALERIPADIRAAGGVSRMSDPKGSQSLSFFLYQDVKNICRLTSCAGKGCVRGNRKVSLRDFKQPAAVPARGTPNP